MHEPAVDFSRPHAPRPIDSVDGMASRPVVGFAIGQGGVSVEAWMDGRCVVRSKPNDYRSAAAVAWPGKARAISSGFLLDLQRDAVRRLDLPELLSRWQAQRWRKHWSEVANAGPRPACSDD